MDTSKLIFYMIITCTVFVLIVLLSKPLKYLFKFFVQGVFGALGFMIVNYLFVSFNLFVGINLLTVFIVAILGVPGFISLYIINLIL